MRPSEWKDVLLEGIVRYDVDGRHYATNRKVAGSIPDEAIF
jgi:hypothetical protein